MEGNAEAVSQKANGNDAALVVGSGVAGLRAALDLADLGFQVYLVERGSFASGTISQLDQQFPTDDCGLCKMLPACGPQAPAQFCLRRGLRHPRIELILNAQVDKVSGTAGDFQISIRQKAPYVNLRDCIGCGLCVPVCPVEVAADQDQATSPRKAIYLPNPLAVPQTYSIDLETCTRCGACTEVCPTGAIDLNRSDRVSQLSAGSVILASGFQEFDPALLSAYGHNRYPNVITSIQLERMLSGMGPVESQLNTLFKQNPPQRMAFIQCVGSRDEEREYCSTACCMYALKEAKHLRGLFPEAQLDFFYMDLRACGKGYHRYYQRVQKDEGIHFVRCRVPSVEGQPGSADLRIRYETDGGELISDEYQLIVLSIGQVPPDQARQMAQIFGIQLDKYGFCRGQGLSGVHTSREGIYVCGSFSGPKDIPESAIQASAAALLAGRHLTPRVPAAEPSSAKETQGDNPPRMGFFFCTCGKTLQESFRLSEVMDYARDLPDVVWTEKLDTLCLPDDLNRVTAAVSEKRLNRVILAACSPALFETLFQQKIREAGLSPEFLEQVNLREQLCWIHSPGRSTTEKAKVLVSMAAQKVRRQRPRAGVSIPVVPKALVIGGGATGMACAEAIVQSGFEVDLVEKAAELGGHLQHIRRTLEGLNGGDLLKDMLAHVRTSDRIRVYLETQVEKVDGHVGNFHARLTSKGSSSFSADYGVVVVATGAKEAHTEEYLSGQDERVISQTELSRLLDTRDPSISALKTVVMIQCVGSRDDQRPYCSKFCCSRAIDNSLRFKEINPEGQIYVLYRDIMTYGFKEEYYLKAREQGVTFLDYDLEDRPRVDRRNGQLEVVVADRILEKDVVISPDLLVLSTGMDPEEHAFLAESLHLPLSANGFLQEMNVKFKPVEFPRSGIFLCGLAHSPRTLSESITQAYGVASRAAAILSKRTIVPIRNFSRVDEDICDGCGICISTCEYRAIQLVAAGSNQDRQQRAEITESLCMGCGCCVAACPCGAIEQAGHWREQTLATIRSALK
jgi:heterodisulfide reductase subunit A